MLNRFATPLSRLYSACSARQGSFLPASKWCPFKSIAFQIVLIQNGELTVQKFLNVGSKSLIHDDMPKRDPPTLYPTDVTTMIVKSAILFWSRLWHRNSPMEHTLTNSALTKGEVYKRRIVFRLAPRSGQDLFKTSKISFWNHLSTSLEHTKIYNPFQNISHRSESGEKGDERRGEFRFCLPNHQKWNLDTILPLR